MILINRVRILSYIYAGEIKKTSERTASSMNWPKEAKAQEVAKNFKSSNPFFTILIKPIHLAGNRLVRT
jgi:hypothetical protein